MDTSQSLMAAVVASSSGHADRVFGHRAVEVQTRQHDRSGHAKPAAAQEQLVAPLERLGAIGACVPLKTADGLAEMNRRRFGLTQRQRTMLLLVDGRRSVAQVMQIAMQAGAPETCFDELLALGLVEMPKLDRSLGASSDRPAAAPSSIDASVESMPMALDSLVPASTLGDSMTSSLFQGLDTGYGSDGPQGRDAEPDLMFDEARRILMRTLRAKAPVTGALTLIRLRRARTRQDLLALFDDIDSHISRPIGQLSAQQTLRHVRALLKRLS